MAVGGAAFSIFLRDMYCKRDICHISMCIHCGNGERELTPFAITMLSRFGNSRAYYAMLHILGTSGKSLRIESQFTSKVSVQTAGPDISNRLTHCRATRTGDWYDFCVLKN
jgi:hypothetical protein